MASLLAIITATIIIRVGSFCLNQLRQDRLMICTSLSLTAIFSQARLMGSTAISRVALLVDMFVDRGHSNFRVCTNRQREYSERHLPCHYQNLGKQTKPVYAYMEFPSHFAVPDGLARYVESCLACRFSIFATLHPCHLFSSCVSR